MKGTIGVALDTVVLIPAEVELSVVASNNLEYRPVLTNGAGDAVFLLECFEHMAGCKPRADYGNHRQLKRVSPGSPGPIRSRGAYEREYSGGG
ncbi:hypothetical protein [Pseudarthrobacter sp. NamB4]|uniref:hypothetical protein n=1 Tax=Pseudarthrobacter sp. NamB4 TaxID=2576837 RepID=UPI0010FDBB99|nr:hypothetical protein [Pseudarthrobacter sp. NamB4]TLM73507.1 hypothetical protein FDW81_08620 [Pseudarthrobacter sp. NamB4]